jgi:imidazoleglycerol-phosphate dehydratase
MCNMRRSELTRETKETSINAILDIDGDGTGKIETGIPFFNHMLDSMSRHGSVDLSLNVKGDLDTGYHHTIEDTGIVLGQVIRNCIGEGRGIKRFASISVPMDESRVDICLDIGGRPYLVFEGLFEGLIEGKIEPWLIRHFFESLVQNAKITLHVNFTGLSDHHKCEVIFKGFGIVLHNATRITRNDGKIPSTKGVL